MTASRRQRVAAPNSTYKKQSGRHCFAFCKLSSRSLL
nr:MAG TPA: hypothetical protein [Caudoviricetes sp.]